MGTNSLSKITLEIIDDLRNEPDHSSGWKVVNGEVFFGEEMMFVSLDKAEMHLIEARALAQAERRFNETWIVPSVDLVNNFVEAAEALHAFLPKDQTRIPEGDRLQVYLPTEENDELGGSLAWWDFVEPSVNLATVLGQVSLLQRKTAAYLDSQK